MTVKIVEEHESGAAEAVAEAVEAAAEAVEAAAEATEAATEGHEGTHEFELHERIVRLEEQASQHLLDGDRHNGLSYESARTIAEEVVNERMAAVVTTAAEVAEEVAEQAIEDEIASEGESEEIEAITVVEPDMTEESRRGRGLLRKIW